MSENENKQCAGMKINVGGQAVIEGVMMRSPHSFVVAVRRKNGEIVVKEDKWVSLFDKYKFLKWPTIRGVIVFFETLINGIQALNFSANQAMEDEAENKEQDAPKKNKSEKVGKFAIASTMFFALGLGIVLFIIIPHLLTEVIGTKLFSNITVENVSFHLIDGIIKVIFFVAYIYFISFLPDIKRVFQYHGAEHKSIFAYESGRELNVENAKQYTTLHPRCGTAFLILVLLISIVVFSLIYPFMPELNMLSKFVKRIIYIFIKLPLLLPIAGISYELMKLSSKHKDSLLLNIIIKPGLWLQKITTSEPDEKQLEVALVSLKKALELEENYKKENPA